MQLLALAAGANVPGKHAVGAIEPGVQLEPAGQSVHPLAAVSLVAAEKLPSGHGSGMLAPSGQYDPAVQSMQLVPPAPDMYVPAAHLTHAGAPVEGETIPGGQGWGAVEPGMHDEPAGHVQHCEAA